MRVVRKYQRVFVDFDPHVAHFECLRCSAAWTPILREGGRLPKQAWVCPNGCNAHLKNITRPEYTLEDIVELIRNY